MTKSEQVLKQNIVTLQNQLLWLDRSYQICKKINLQKALIPEEMDALETLTSRYARTVDYLIRKVFRSIDDAEFENQGTLIDVVNNAEKRQLIPSVQKMREIKEIRNEVVNEYVQQGLENLFSDVVINTRFVIEIAQTTIKYCENQREI